MISTRHSYGTSREVELDFLTAVARARALLAEHGFGILCEIDIAATLRAKAGVDLGDYVILGACKPDSARIALAADPDVGLLLPCNVIVRRAAGHTTVGVVDADAMLAFTGHQELGPVAADVNARLTAVLEAFGPAAG